MAPQNSPQPRRRGGESPARGPWYRAGLPFECTQCGKCCHGRGEYTHVYVSKRERRAIAAWLGMTSSAFTRRYTVVDGEGYRTVRFEAEACPFLDGTSCRIHPVKPVQCRTWPFWFELLESREIYEREVRSFCPGSRAGGKVAYAEIERQARATEAEMAVQLTES